MNKKYIICGKFFDGINEVLEENIKIIVEGELIVAVGKDLECPEDAGVIDLSHLTVTPGLIDSHVHFDFKDSKELSTYAFTDSDEMKALNTVYCATKSLEGGFTTIRTMGSAFVGFGQMDAKRAIDKGMFVASRLIVAPHALNISGGHWDFSQHTSTNPFLSEMMEKEYVSVGNGVDRCKSMVRKQFKYGADFIKIMAAGGFGSPNDSPVNPQFDDDEVKAIVETTNSFGSYVAAHAYTAEAIENLINLGVKEIEHGALLKESTAKLMEEKGTILVCTMTPYEEVIQNDEEKLAQKSIYFRNKLKLYGKQLIESREIIKDMIISKKVLVGYGSDIVAVYNNYDCWVEFKSWRDNGIPALRTLVAATSDNAKIIQRPDLGSLEPGKIADIAAWSSDIIEDHEALKVCDFVMKEGKIFKQ
ncbi:MAG: amidohydrolase family protein [Tissierellia bacterium]|nr:amidohydrolase family protein [Tissierellia bacterium]MDD4780897.1 amidohydrolase family protein [Tissierellia bacterium]